MGRAVLPCALLAPLLLACGVPDSADEPVPVATPSVVLSQPTAIEGRRLELVYRFDVSADVEPLRHDHRVFVHLRDAHGELIGTDDHEPATPTSAWRPGTRVTYPRSMFVPKTGYAGPVSIEVGLYRPATDERLPVGGASVYEPRATYVGGFEILADRSAVVFREGWHAREAPKGAGGGWRWSMKAGRLTLPNPARDAVLVLLVDQPAMDFPVDQHVEIRLSDAVVDAFDLPRGHLELRRIPLSAGQLGTGETVDVLVVVDKTFVPAESLPGSDDDRQLGLRLFHTYVEPIRGETDLHLQ